MSRARSVHSVFCRVAVGALGALLLQPLVARAFVPESERVAKAIARANVEARRNQPLQLQLAVRVGDGPIVAQGELDTQPSGVARLELRGAEGLRERHLLHDRGYVATRNGQRLDDPRAMLPPLFFLQAGSRGSLQPSLRAFGVDPAWVGLAPCGPENCYVLGDPTRVPPPPVDTEEGAAPEGFVQEEPPVPLPRPDRFGSFWVEKESFQPRRMRSPGDTRVEFGPEAGFGKISVPAWFEVREPGRDPVRFEIQAVSKSPLSPEAFGVDWVNEAPQP